MSKLRQYTILLDGLIALGLFGLALWLRQDNLIHFVTADEHNWVYRSGLFLHALIQQDWVGTSVWYTPAVTTTWLGSASLAIFYKMQPTTLNQPLAEWLLSFPRNRIDLHILLALRWSTVLFTSLMVALIYALARNLWPRPLALLGALFLLTEPHLLAVSRIIGHDAPITFLSTASLLSFFYARRLMPKQPQSGFWAKTYSYRYFILSGLWTGLAILSKAPAIILLPFIGVMALVDLGVSKDKPNQISPRLTFARQWLLALTIWAGITLLTFILFWPAAWIDPLGQIWYVISRAFFSSTGLEDGDIQPFWSIPNLGAFYYLINGMYKISPFLTLGVLLAIVGGALKIRRERPSLANLINLELFWLTIFVILFTIMMTLGVKKSPRYILPTFPPLSFIAAWGWLNLLNLPLIKSCAFIKSRPMLRYYWKTGTILILGTLAVLFTFNYAPYYFTYFNPLLGGSSTAPTVVRIGWGEGLDELGRWFKAQPDAAANRVGVRYTATLYPFYQGNIASPISEELDFVAFYIKQSQSGYPAPEILAYFENQPSLHRVELNGIEYAQVYQGPGAIPIGIDAANMPLAYRPATIYAPLGDQLNIDLLWGLSPLNDDLVQLTLQSPAGTIILESQAKIKAETKGVRVSKHHFDIPNHRETYTLWLNDQSLGQIKARLLDIPPDFKSLDAVLAGQLKLAGSQQTVAEQHLYLDLAWQGWPQASNDYTVFVQLLDQNEQRVAGVDVAPEKSFTSLDRKEIMITHYDIPLPDDLPPDSYRALVGLYYFAGDELINVGAVTLESLIILK